MPVDAVRVLAERDRVLAAREFNPEPDWRTRLFEWFVDRFEGLASFLPVGLRAVGLVLGSPLWLWRWSGCCAGTGPARYLGAGRSESRSLGHPDSRACTPTPGERWPRGNWPRW